MNSKTKTVGVFLALSLATSLVACGGNNPANEGGEAEDQVQPTEQKPLNAPNQDDEGGEGGEGGEG